MQTDKKLASFLKLLKEMEQRGFLKDFFRLFFTIEEREMLIKRYNIIQALLEGTKTQREMSEQLDVSISQITRGSNELKQTTSRFTTALRDAICSK